MRPGVVIGALMVAVGVVLVLMPEQLADALRRPYETAGEKINMRATWGGLVTGVGLLVAWLPSPRPRRRFALGLVMWVMVGIAFGRGVGFALDGSPDTLQWVWMVAEVLIACGCAVALRRAVPKDGLEQVPRA